MKKGPTDIIRYYQRLKVYVVIIVIIIITIKVQEIIMLKIIPHHDIKLNSEIHRKEGCYPLPILSFCVSEPSYHKS